MEQKRPMGVVGGGQRDHAACYHGHYSKANSDYVGCINANDMANVHICEIAITLNDRQIIQQYKLASRLPVFQVDHTKMQTQMHDLKTFRPLYNICHVRGLKSYLSSGFFGFFLASFKA